MKVNKQWKLQGLHEWTTPSQEDWEIWDTWEQGSCHWAAMWLDELLPEALSSELCPRLASYDKDGWTFERCKKFKTHLYFDVSMPWTHVGGSQRVPCRSQFSASIQVGLIRLSGTGLDHNPSCEVLNNSVRLRSRDISWYHLCDG